MTLNLKKGDTVTVTARDLKVKDGRAGRPYVSVPGTASVWYLDNPFPGIDVEVTERAIPDWDREGAVVQFPGGAGGCHWVRWHLGWVSASIREYGVSTPLPYDEMIQFVAAEGYYDPQPILLHDPSR